MRVKASLFASSKWFAPSFCFDVSGASHFSWSVESVIANVESSTLHNASADLLCPAGLGKL